MKKLTIAKIQSLLNAARKKHDAQQAKYVKEYKDHKVRAFDNSLGYSGLQWKPRSQVFKGCNGKAMLNPIDLQATSYGHWTFVTLINGKVVFNDYTYSNTTSGHQCSVKSLLKTLGIKIDLMVDFRDSLSSYSFKEKALKSMYKTVYSNEIAMQRKGSKPEANKERAKEIKAMLKDIKVARAMGAKFTREEMRMLKESLLSDEAQRLEEMRLASVKRSELNRQARAVLKNAFSDGSEKPVKVADAETENALNNAFDN